MQLRKNPSVRSTYSSKNIDDQQLLEKAIKKQLPRLDHDLSLTHTHTHTHSMSKTPMPQVLSFDSHSKIRECKLLKIEIIQEEEQRKLKLRTTNRHLLNYFPVYTTLMDSEFFKQSHCGLDGVTRNMAESAQLKNERQSITFQRKKLSPIKKSKFEKRTQSRNVHVSFLSVQKAPFFLQDVNNCDKNSMTVTTSAFSKNKFLITKKSFQSSQTMQTPNPQKSIFSKQQLTRMTKNRPFIPPFQRYHYFDFLWKVSLSNGLKLEFPSQLAGKKYKAYIGRGNNSNLIKTLLKRRQAWWAFTDKIQQANFVWTQIKVNSIFAGQGDCQPAPFVGESENVVSVKTPIYKRNRKIMNDKLTEAWIKYFYEHKETQEKLAPNFMKRNRAFRTTARILQPDKLKVHNHLPRNYVLGNKKALFATMKHYYELCNKNVFSYLPLTFHIKNGLQDPQYFTFLKHFHSKQKQNKKQHLHHRQRNIWIVKPGELTNRGNGITVCHTFQQIKTILRNRIKLDDGTHRTYIIQQYIQKPFLYHGRKFDIRHYMLLTSTNGHIKGYWCELGYIRTTSYEYSVANGFSSVHLTNDAVQKGLPDYGKYEKGNKLSYGEFQGYLQAEWHGKFSFYKSVYPQMKSIAYDSMRASALMLDSERKGHNFQIFGFDFMIDSKFHPWLIQINTNPCLQLNCPVLLQVIPQMLQNALKIALDPLFPPPQSFEQKRSRFSNNVLQENYFELLYDSGVEETGLRELMGMGGDRRKEEEGGLNFGDFEKDQEEVYQDDGIMLED